MELERIFDGPAVGLQEVLDNRSRRVERQKRLLAVSGANSLVSFTLNIPGEIKQFALARAAFREGNVALEDALAEHIVRREAVDLATGSEALLALDMEPRLVKEMTVAIEDAHPLGRLFDMDVLDHGGDSLSRRTLGAPPRKCLICGMDAKLCGRSRAHAADALRLEVARRLEGYFRDQAADRCANLATRALLYEVSTTPKPGLVDRNNSGSHRDMDFYTFLDSSSALAPSFREMFCIGWESDGEDATALLSRLRFAGRKAERLMLDTTRGANTHKGLIFSLGLLCGALGANRWFTDTTKDIEKVFDLCAEMGKLSLRDLEGAGGTTNGERCYHRYQVTGIRGEAAQGFPSARRVGLPMIKRRISEGMSLNDASAAALLALIAKVYDTNMIRRGGYKQAKERRAEAEFLSENLNGQNCIEVIRELDADYIKANLSPGGCADLLAISLMLYFIEQEAA